MKKNTLVISLLPFFLMLTYVGWSQAEAPNIEWQNTIGGSASDRGRAVATTSDGGYIIGGFSESNISEDKAENALGLDDYWVIKLDASGNIEWENTIGGSQSDQIHSIAQTTDGGYIIGGYSSSPISGDKTADVEGNTGNNDYWVVKLSSTGTIEWQNTIGGNGVDELWSIIQSSDGGYLLGGSSTSGISGDKSEDSRGMDDYWVVKLSSTGSIEWQKTIGGSANDVLYSVAQSTDGGYILGGSSESNISGDKTEDSQGSNDYWVVKLNAMGVIQWQNTIGGEEDDGFQSLVATPDGGAVLAGDSDSPISGDKDQDAQEFSGDAWIVKVSSIGVIEWQNTIGSSGSEAVVSIAQTTDNGFFVGTFSRGSISGDKTEDSGGINPDYWVLKLDAVGNLEWEKTIGGSGTELLRAVDQAEDGGYILVGSSDSDISRDKTENNLGVRDVWVVKLAGDNQVSEELPIFGKWGIIGLSLLILSIGIFGLRRNW